MAENKDDNFDDDIHQEWKEFTKSIRKISNKKFDTEKNSIKKEIELEQDRANFQKQEPQIDNLQNFSKNHINFSNNNLLNEASKIEINNFKGIDKNLYRDIISGKVAPNVKLDLHGHTITEAHNIVINFITRCFLNKNRLILIVTGKGKDKVKNTIRGNFEMFLNSSPIKEMILFSSKAALRHGGSGAFYVFLRKS